MIDISKIPRLPGDGAQDDSNSKFDESSNKHHMSSGSQNVISHGNIASLKPPINQGKKRRKGWLFTKKVYFVCVQAH